MYFVKIYVYHHTKLFLRQIRYKESCFHAKLLRQHRRHKSRSASKTIDVYPQIIVDVPKVKLNQSQLDYIYLINTVFTIKKSKLDTAVL